MGREANGSVKYVDPCALLITRLAVSYLWTWSVAPAPSILLLQKCTSLLPHLLHLVFWAVKASQQLVWMWMASSVAVCAPFETLPFARHLHLSISIRTHTNEMCFTRARPNWTYTWVTVTAIWRCAACILLRPFMSMIGRENEKKESEHSRPRLCFTCFLTLEIATIRFFFPKIAICLLWPYLSMDWPCRAICPTMTLPVHGIGRVEKRAGAIERCFFFFSSLSQKGFISPSFFSIY